ncbi:MAG: AzlD domain-containing protein [Alphaproteobacteria bacterium]|jgi:branched-subunit amino acid transport protein|nr:AzlD domain-containing protein [Alphaproteobacteria bacterium]MDP6589313.1 AzlD domain-containing protein [Alphaproteobacteria bacterium]MDP6819830.1 AzlD domain-containing protein [Alphaproteobacteria bacterium]
MSESAAWLALPAAVAVSFLWRAVGVAVSGRIDPDSDVFLWVQCVAYAMLAGLVSRMLFLPSGALAESELWIRLAAVGIGLAICFALRRNLLVGVLAGVAAFLVLQYVQAPG